MEKRSLELCFCLKNCLRKTVFLLLTIPRLKYFLVYPLWFPLRFSRESCNSIITKRVFKSLESFISFCKSVFCVGKTPWEIRARNIVRKFWSSRDKDTWLMLTKFTGFFLKRKPYKKALTSWITITQTLFKSGNPLLNTYWESTSKSLSKKRLYKNCKSMKLLKRNWRTTKE